MQRSFAQFSPARPTPTYVDITANSARASQEGRGTQESTNMEEPLTPTTTDDPEAHLLNHDIGKTM
eukprot:12937988-Prorocentrum_lima.AAC.1